MSRIVAIAKRIWSQFAHDPRTLALLFVAPLLMLWLLSILLVSDTYKPKIVEVDLPSEFVKVLDEQDAYIVSADSKDAMRMLENSEVDAILSMKPGTTELCILNEGTSMSKNQAVSKIAAEAVSDFGEEARADLQAYIDEKKAEMQSRIDEMKAKREDIQRQIEEALQRLAAKSLGKLNANSDVGSTSLDSGSPQNILDGIDIDSLSVDDSTFDFEIDMNDFMPIQSVQTEYLHGSSDWEMFDFYGPIFIALFLFVFVFITCSFSLVNERAAGTMERFLDTPVKPAQILAGYALGFGAMSLVQAAIILSFGLGVIGFPNEGNIGLVVLIAISLAVASVMLGLLVSGLATAAFQVVQLMLLFVVPQILLCGLFDLSASPEFLQVLSQCLPLTYGVNAMTQVMLGGAGFADIWIDFAVIWGFIIAFFAISALRFRKKRAH